MGMHPRYLDYVAMSRSCKYIPLNAFLTLCFQAISLFQMNDPIPNLPAKWANFLINEIIRCPPSATIDTDFVISDVYEPTHVVRSLPQDDAVLPRADRLQYHRNMIRKYELLLTDYLSQARIDINHRLCNSYSDSGESTHSQGTL